MRTLRSMTAGLFACALLGGACATSPAPSSSPASSSPASSSPASSSTSSSSLRGGPAPALAGRCASGDVVDPTSGEPSLRGQPPALRFTHDVLCVGPWEVTADARRGSLWFSMTFRDGADVMQEGAATDRAAALCDEESASSSGGRRATLTRWCEDDEGDAPLCRGDERLGSARYRVCVDEGGAEICAFVPSVAEVVLAREAGEPDRRAEHASQFLRAVRTAWVLSPAGCEEAWRLERRERGAAVWTLDEERPGAPCDFELQVRLHDVPGFDVAHGQAEVSAEPALLQLDCALSDGELIPLERADEDSLSFGGVSLYASLEACTAAVERRREFDGGACVDPTRDREERGSAAP